MTQERTGGIDAPAQPQIVDVWCRTSRGDRRRSVLMLLLLAVLFAGLCCFTFWIRTGEYWPWRSERYGDFLARSFTPTGTSQITLTDFLTSPISVKEVPVHGVIMGLLLASLSSIPILVAILYRFPCSIFFAAMVSLLAVLPWLGITVLLGCLLTALRPFRFSFRYASALIGLIPIAVYFVTASLEPAGAPPRLVENLALLYAPWVLAVLGSCIICAVALGIAKLINYRPGGIPVLLMVLFAAPVLLFHNQVGRDELEYRLVEKEIGPRSRTMFTRLDVGEEADRAATRDWSRSKLSSYDEIHRQVLEETIAEVQERTETDRGWAVALCERFILHFPKSRHVPSVLFLKGRAQDQQLEKSVLERDRVAEYRSDMPSAASRLTWETLAERFPDDLLCAAALYRLAILRAREGDFPATIELLDRLTQQFAPERVGVLEQAAAVQRGGSVLRRAPGAMVLGADVHLLVREGRRLKEMLAACRHDQPKAYAELFCRPSDRAELMVHPMQVLLWLDDTDPHYVANLEGLAEHLSGSQTSGYVEIRLALQERAVSRRIRRFQLAAQSLSSQPSGAEALYYLGDSLQEDSIFDEAKLVFDRLSKDYPESCWGQEAKERLASLSMLELKME